MFLLISSEELVNVQLNSRVQMASLCRWNTVKEMCIPWYKPSRMFYLLLPTLTHLQGAFEIVQKFDKTVIWRLTLSSLKNKFKSLDKES